MQIAKRIPLYLLLAAAPLSASAGLAQEDMVRVIANLDLERGRVEAYARCVKDAPAVRELMSDPVVERYCVFRHGAPRKVAIFVGERLAAELDDAGMKKQSEVVEALLDVQEKRP